MKATGWRDFAKRERANHKMNKKAVAVVHVGGWPYATEISMIVSMFLSLPDCTFDIFESGKGVNHRGKCGLKFPANFHFCGPEKTIRLTKKYNKD